MNDFQASYESEYMQGSLPECYNGYYDNKNPLPFEINRESNKRQLSSFDELFSNSKVNLVLISIAMQNDIATLEQIADQSIPLKTFDYDGEKFKRKEARSLIIRLNTKLEQLNEEIRQNDVSIFEFFREQEHAKNNGNQLENLYQEYFSFDKDFDTKYEIYTGLSNDLQFINFTTPIDQIKLNFMNLKPLETKLKNEIQSILTDNRYREDMTKDMKTNFDLYLSNELVYFANEAYQEEKLEILYVAMNNYSYLLSKGYFLLKKKLLNYQEELMIPVVS